MSSNWLDDPNFAKQLAYGTASGNAAVALPANPKPPQPWIQYLIFGALVFIAMWMVWPKGSSDDGAPLPVQIDGLHVLIVEQNEDRENLTPEQLAVFNSVKLRKLVDSMDGEFRLLDVDDDLRKYPKEWRAMAESTLKPPFVVVANGRKAIQFELKDLDQTIERIESMGVK